MFVPWLGEQTAQKSHGNVSEDAVVHTESQAGGCQVESKDTSEVEIGV
jgi:hypothetical protein